MLGEYYTPSTGDISGEALKALLTHLYYESRMESASISCKLGVPVSQVENWFAEFEIAGNVSVTKDLLEEMYYFGGMTKDEIGKKLRLSERQLNTAFKEHGISLTNAIIARQERKNAG